MVGMPPLEPPGSRLTWFASFEPFVVCQGVHVAGSLRDPESVGKNIEFGQFRATRRETDRNGRMQVSERLAYVAGSLRDPESVGKNIEFGQFRATRRETDWNGRNASLGETRLRGRSLRDPESVGKNTEFGQFRATRRETDWNGRNASLSRDSPTGTFVNRSPVLVSSTRKSFRRSFGGILGPWRARSVSPAKVRKSMQWPPFSYRGFLSCVQGPRTLPLLDRAMPTV